VGLDAQALSSPSTPTTLPLTYRSLLKVRGLPRLVGAALLGRIGGQMESVALVLFALQRFHSPAIAGVTVFAYAFPGVLFSPLAGAILDRRGRATLIMIDYSVAAVAMVAIVVLGQAGVLSAALLVGIAALSSVTGPLSSAGTRTLFPMLVPRHLWDRANAVDSAGFVVAAVVGAPLAGVITGLVSSPAALAATAVVFVAAALSLLGMAPFPSPPPRSPSQSVLRDARDGLAYVARNPTLRGLAVSLSGLNLASGLLIVGLPVLVLDHLHQNAAVVGGLWALSAASGGIAAVVLGHLGSHGRERRLIVAGMLATGAALAALAIAPNLLAVALAMLVYGGAAGPIDIGMFSMRQRRTDAAWYGRAFAVSMSLNYVGNPIGSAAAGPLLGVGLAVGLAAGAGLALAAAAVTMVMVPASARDPRSQQAPRPGS
jgi:MFS family permease